MTDRPRIAHASFTSLTTGLVELSRDWPEKGLPPLELLPVNGPLRVTKISPQLFGLESGYFFFDGKITFVLDPEHYPWIRDHEAPVLVGGEFNGWNPGAEAARWELKETRIGGRMVLAATFPDAPAFSGGRVQFKFMVGLGHWLSPPDEAPNRVGNELWNINLEIDPARTGHHRFRFATIRPANLSEETYVSWRDTAEEKVLVTPGPFFYRMHSDLPLGAIVQKNRTIFRLFAPRARQVEVRYFQTLDGARAVHQLKLVKAATGVWEGTVSRNLHRWYYWFFLDGVRNASLHLQPEFPVVDPYAQALVCREGPGIILERSRIGAADRSFRPPQWQDLVIAELHVRDAVARAPVRMREEERLGFTGLAKWVRSDDFYLKGLGVNAVELQPVQEFDNESKEEYHWGYMPVNFFAPESSYSLHPERASQVAEFRDVVRAFHEQGVAVILDVVYNHAGIPNHLLFIDKQYYFELDADGRLLNWSGCGNDLRANAVMARRLIVDSLVHLVETYGVDGFRFDLAELLGVETLREIERRLKAVKPEIILIAEPWSFRGHIGRQLRQTGFSSWNDGFRDFMSEFVRGHANHEAVKFFLSGSPGSLATWPAQTVNYVESHDDRTWIDSITENEGQNGFHPTGNDRRRTHLMAAFLFSSIGIPMISAGQDFLRSKHGVNNTYKRGDLNALDYERLADHASTHRYFADWIQFRLSARGKLFRLWSRPTNTFLKFAFSEHAVSFAACFNADGSHGEQRLLLAINPHDREVTVPLDEWESLSWTRLANAEQFDAGGLPGEEWQTPGQVMLGPLECGLWEAWAR